MQHHKPTILALILAPFVFSFAFGMDIYVPVLPHMRAVFHTSQFMIQLTLSLFILTIGIGELIIGPLSDQFGRLKVIVLSTLLFMVGSIGCAVAPNVVTLIVSRMICAFGACGMLVVAFAIVRDLHSGDTSAQLYSWLNAAIGISPTFAPIIGGFLAVYFGWRSVFWFLVLMGAVVIILTVFSIRETLQPKLRKPVTRAIFKRYAMIFTNNQFLRYMLFAAAGVTLCFSFFSVSPFIIIDILHVKEQIFGFYFAAFGLVLLIGGIIAGKLVVKWGIDKTIKVGIGLMLIGGILMALCNWLLGLHLYSFLLTMVIACCGGVFCLGAAGAGAMEPFPEIAGTAAAALQSGEFIIASVIGTVLMHFPIHSSYSFATCIILVSIGCIFVSIFIRK